MAPKVFAAPAPAPPLPATSIGALLSDRAQRFGAREFLRFEGRSLTYGEVEEQSSRVANALAALGIRRGDRVGIMLPNGLDYPVTWLGVIRLGAVVVPCNTGYGDRDLGFVLQDSGARAVVTDAERALFVAAVGRDCSMLERILVWGAESSPDPATAGFDPLVRAASASWSDAALGPGDLATLQYTSGTTGFPKGCMITHEYWLRLADGAAREARLGDGDVNLIVTAWYYMDAGWNLLLCCIKGIPLVILPRFSASTFWRSIVENGATFFYCLGTMPTVLLKQPENAVLERGHKVRAVICSAIPPTLHAAIEARFGCIWREGYSTTEIGPACLTVPLDDASTVGSGAMGRPAPGAEARVVDPAGEEVSRGEVGELLMRGPGMMLGYWQNPEATAAWLVDGWAHTGDLVFEDERGYYHIVGRLKEMIRRGGENIASAEVEATLCEHPAVRSAACVPVADEIRGEEVKAFIQLQPGAPPESAAPEALLAFCRGKLARFKVPRYFAYIDEFPLTPSQRVEKHRLDRTARGAWDAVVGEWRT